MKNDRGAGIRFDHSSIPAPVENFDRLMNTCETTAGLDESLQRNPFQVVERHGRIIQKDDGGVILKGIVGEKKGCIGHPDVKSIFLSQLFYRLNPAVCIRSCNVPGINQYQRISRPLVLAGKSKYYQKKEKKAENFPHMGIIK
jgi:hypothetical protein